MTTVSTTTLHCFVLLHLVHCSAKVKEYNQLKDTLVHACNQSSSQGISHGSSITYAQQKHRQTDTERHRERKETKRERERGENHSDGRTMIIERSSSWSSSIHRVQSSGQTHIDASNRKQSLGYVYVSSTQTYAETRANSYESPSWWQWKNMQQSFLWRRRDPLHITYMTWLMVTITGSGMALRCFQSTAWTSSCKRDQMKRIHRKPYCCSLFLSWSNRILFYLKQVPLDAQKVYLDTEQWIE